MFFHEWEINDEYTQRFMFNSISCKNGKPNRSLRPVRLSKFHLCGNDGFYFTNVPQRLISASKIRGG